MRVDCDSRQEERTKRGESMSELRSERKIRRKKGKGKEEYSTLLRLRSGKKGK